MRDYRFICQTVTTGLPWSVGGTFPSHRMALEYGAKIALDFANCFWFKALDVWVDVNLETEDFIGSITLNKPTTTISEN